MGVITVLHGSSGRSGDDFTKSDYFGLFFFFSFCLFKLSLSSPVSTGLCSLTPSRFLSASFILQGLGLDVVGHASGSGQRQNGVVDGSHLHGQRDGILMLVVSCTVVLTGEN